MTSQDLLLVAGMAGLAVIITLADLLFSLWRHSRRVARPHESNPGGSSSTPGEAAATARRETIRRRLAAIQSAHRGSE